MARDIIFECRVGSHLFGTNRPDSDEDFQGVFLPSREELLGIEDPVREWDQSNKASTTDKNTLGDIDRKYYSLRRFCQLALQGQPGQLEMLFAPMSCVTTIRGYWDVILGQRNIFFSKSAIRPFLGFAASQAHKAHIKTENLNLIRALLDAVKPLYRQDNRIRIRDILTDGAICGIPIKRFINEYGWDMVEIAHRQYNIGGLVRAFIESLTILESRYGQRVQRAANKGEDYKSLMHAYRLIGEAEEFLLTGLITLPRSNATYLKRIREGTVEQDWHSFLLAEIERIESDVLYRSDLPDKPNALAVEALCIKIHGMSLCCQ